MASFCFIEEKYKFLLLMYQEAKFMLVHSLAHRRNAVSSSLFYRCYFLRCSSELAQLVQVKSLFCVDLIVIVIDCMIFRLPSSVL